MDDKNKPVVVESEAYLSEGKVVIPQTGFENANYAFRVFDTEGNQVLYRSTRLGQVKITDDGIEVDAGNAEIADKKYELKDIHTKDVIAGIIEAVPESAPTSTQDTEDHGS